MKSILQTLITVLAVSCGGSGGGGGGSSDNLDLTGSWLASCEDNSGESSQLEWIISSSVATFRQTFFSSTGCNGSDRYEVNNYNYSYETTSTSFIGTLTTFEITLTDATTVTNENIASYCGFTDWVIDTLKDVTGQNCDGSTENAGDTSTADVSLDGDTMTLSSVVYTKQ